MVVLDGLCRQKAVVLWAEWQIRPDEAEVTSRIH